jgi:hypothetical protein
LISSAADLAAYLSHDDIACLECGRRFAALGTHLRKAHQMTARAYRETWHIPAGAALAGLAYREARAEIATRLIAEGSLIPNHAAANEAAREAGKRSKVDWQAADHAAIIKAVRPGDHGILPPGSKRRDGRDADKAREYQRNYRRRSSG